MEVLTMQPLLGYVLHFMVQQLLVMLAFDASSHQREKRSIIGCMKMKAVELLSWCLKMKMVTANSARLNKISNLDRLKFMRMMMSSMKKLSMIQRSRDLMRCVNVC